MNPATMNLFRSILRKAWLIAAMCVMWGCGGDRGDSLVIYTSQDEVYARPILDKFTERTGIQVQAVFDSEAVKTTALAQRLAAERGNPRCDVFWSNEEMKARQLVAEGILETNLVTTVYRARHIVINTNLVSLESAPQSIREFQDTQWKGRISFAYPFFGTTANHFQMLRMMMPPEKWEGLMSGLSGNDPHIVDGNSQVVRLVGTGQRAVGLTDTDDVRVGLSQGYPIHSYPDNEMPVRIFNCVALVRNAPHRDMASELIDYLTSAEVSQSLIEVGAADGLPGPDDPAETHAPLDQDNWNRLIDLQKENEQFLKDLFLRQ